MAMDAGKIWEHDAESCSICNAALGPFRRHHCRICGRCVCAACSPSSVQLQGGVYAGSLQRACTPCVAIAALVPASRSRLVALGEQLQSFCGASPSVGSAVDSVGLNDAIGHCEDGVQRWADQVLLEQQARQRLEAQVGQAVESLARLAGRLQALGADIFEVALENAAGVSLAPPEEALGAIVALCNSSVSALERARSCPDFIEVGSAGDTDEAWAWEALSSPGSQHGSAELQSCEDIDAGDAWEPDASNCAICGKALGALRGLASWRHHCRICGRCVCAACSPNSVQLSGGRSPKNAAVVKRDTKTESQQSMITGQSSGAPPQGRPQRACTPCVAVAQRAPDIRKRLLRLGVRLHALCGVPAARFARSVGIEEALDFCDAAAERLSCEACTSEHRLPTMVSDDRDVGSGGPPTINSISVVIAGELTVGVVAEDTVLVSPPLINALDAEEDPTWA